MTKRFLKIDELKIGEHHFLGPADECYYLVEYSPGHGFDYSKTNDLISNFKKPVYRLRDYEWKYKDQAIEKIARMFLEVIGKACLSAWTLVPIPPSKCKKDSHYDDRMSEVLRLITKGISCDVREIIYCVESTPALHLSIEKRNPSVLKENYVLDESLTSPRPTRILLFDDLITSGAHYRACTELLEKRFPGVLIKGVFVARRALPPGSYQNITNNRF